MGQDDKVLHRSGIKMDGYSGDIGMFTAFMQVLFYHPAAGLCHQFYRRADRLNNWISCSITVRNSPPGCRANQLSQVEHRGC